MCTVGSQSAGLDVTLPVGIAFSLQVCVPHILPVGYPSLTISKLVLVQQLSDPTEVLRQLLSARRIMRQMIVTNSINCH